MTIFGGEGNDTLAVLAGTQVTVFGDAGNDSLAVLGGTLVTVFGGLGDDTLAVTAGAQVTIFGGDGNDSLSVGGVASEVTVFGGDGNDTLAVLGGTLVTVFGDAGNDTLAVLGGSQVTVFGGLGDDSLSVSGTASHVTVFGGDGNDTLAVLGGSQVTVFGGLGDDSLSVSGTASEVTVFGGDGNDTLAVLGGTLVTVFGGDGNDTLAVLGGSQVTVFGGLGDDTLAVLGGTLVTVFGDAGNDSLVVAGGTEVTVFGADGNDTIAVTAGSQVTIFGGDGNDSLSVGNVATQVTVFGGIGDDTLAVTGGTQVTVFGAEGNDSLIVAGGTLVTVFGGDGNDTLAVTGGIQVTVFGAEGNDSLVVAGGTQVTVFGGDGNDTLAITAGTQVTVFGNEGNDTIAVGGLATQVTVFGGDGNDSLIVAGGTLVTVFGGLGDDTLAVTAGTQVTVFGDDGDDTISVGGLATQVTVFGADGNDSLVVAGGIQVTVFGGRGDDTLGASAGTGVKLYGEVGNDAMTVSGGLNVTVAGGSGNDTLTASGGTGVVLLGGTGTDQLTATATVDVTLSGGSGDDVLAADRAAVYLFGDDGNDAYRFAAAGTQAVVVKEILIQDVTTFEATSTAEVETAKGGEAAARGSDTLDLSAYTTATVNLSVFGSEADPETGNQIVASGLTLTIFGTFENVIGTAGNDTLVGNAAANKLDGAGGNDWIDGQAGDDTLTGGTGNDTLIGGTGNDTFAFIGSALGADAVTEAANADGDSLDFSEFTTALTLDIGSTAAQPFGANLTLTLTNGTGIENVVGTAFSDAITGNARDNTLEGGAGNDTLGGGAGSDTYVFSGSGLGADRVTEAPNADADTLDFAQLDAPVTLDLASTATQLLGAAGQSLTLSDGLGVENAIGTSYADVLRGNERDNALYGAGGADVLEGRGGADNLQGDFSQVVLLDFDSATNETSGDHVYTPAERAALVARLQVVFGPFNYVFTTDPGQAAALTAHSGRRFDTLVFNDGAGGGIGGESNELDFGNRIHGDRGTVNINNLLGGDGQPAATSANVVGLTASITAHELAHMAGLLHTDAFGPIGTGVFAGVVPTRYLPEYTGPLGANETPHHVMASPLSLGTTLFDATAATNFGAREAIKLAFNETGTVRTERTTAAGSHQTFAAAEALGVLPGLAVPNTLVPGDRDHGKTFDVSALSVIGNIQLAAGKSENDVYSFIGRAGDVMNLSVISGVLNPYRGNPIDGVLKLYGSNGQLLATNDDGPEARDPAIIDFVLPADGVYYVVVDTFASEKDEDIGRYELFLYRFAATAGTAAANLGDTIVGGAGSDTVTGSAADDVFRTTGAAAGDEDVYHGKVGYDILDLTGFPQLEYTADGMELVRGGVNASPTLLPVSTVVAPSGGFITIAPVASDPDGNDQLTFTLSPTGEPGHTFPVGASVDPRTGVITWVSGQPGTYTVLLTATDPTGATVTRTVTFVVSNVVPTVSVGGNASLVEGGTLTRAGSFADVGADNWTATVNYGDGGTQPLVLNEDMTFTLSHPYADSGTYTVTVIVNDGTTASAPASFVVTAANVAPTATLTNSGPVAEGDSATVTFSAPFDPSAPDTAAGFKYSFALSVGGLAGSYAAASATPSAAFPFPASGSYTVYGRVFDRDNGFTDYATTVLVTNVAPTVTAAVNSVIVIAGTAVTVSGTVTTSGGDVDDPGQTWEVLSSNGQVVASGSGSAITFTPNAGGTYTIVFKVTDEDGATAVSTVEITVVAPPAGVVTNSGPVVEGGTATVTLTPTNVSPENVPALRYAYDFDNDGTFDLGTGTYAGSVAENAATVPTSYLADGPFNRVVTVRVIDAAGAFTDATTTIAVTNAAPVVTLGGALQLTESAASFTRSGSFADAGADTWTATVDYGAGAGQQSLTLNADKSFSLSHAYADNGNYTVTVRVTDDNGGVGTASFAVSVANVAPTAAFGNGGAVNEGSTGSVSFTSQSEPSAADVAAGLRYSYDFDNDGVFEIVNSTSPTAVVPASLLANGPSDRVVAGRILDKDGGFTDYTTTITVNNVVPTVNVGGMAVLTTPTLTRSGSFTDPGADAWTATVDYGDGTGTQPLTLNADKTFALNHTYAGGGFFTATVTVNDGTAAGTGSIQVVFNIPAEIEAGPAQTAAEGAAVSLAGATFSNPYSTGLHTATINWGDGTAVESAGVSQSAAGGGVDGTLSGSHRYADNGTYTVTITVTVPLGATSSDTFTVTVDNVAPTLAVLTGPTLVIPGQPLTYTAAFTDPGFDNPLNAGEVAETFTGTVNWGDGSATEAAAMTWTTGSSGVLSMGSAGKGHTYAVAGNYTVTLTLNDDDAGTATRTLAVTVTESAYLLAATGTALSVSGGGRMIMPGVIEVNSTSPTAITASGSAQISATHIHVVGGFSAIGNATIGPAPTTGGAATADPLASLTAPVVAGTVGSVDLMGSAALTIGPGRYSQIKVSGFASLTMLPGVYVILGGGMSVTGNANITGNGVTIYNAGSNYPAAGGTFGGFALTGRGDINLSAPAVGEPYAGILVFQSRDNTRAMAVSGTGLLGTHGTIYAPAAQLALSGGAELKAALVVNSVSVSSNATSSLLVEGDLGVVGLANTLLSADLWVYVDNGNAGFGSSALAAIDSAIAGLNATLLSHNVVLTVVNSPDVANLVIEAAPTTPLGGVAAGVLGFFAETAGQGEITLVQGWNWYLGQDPVGIGQTQYDFQTVVLHELGHALGLGHNADATSVMHSELGTGTVKRAITEADLNIPELHDDEGGEGLFAEGSGQAETPTLAAPETVNSTPAGPASMAPFGFTTTLLAPVFRADDNDGVLDQRPDTLVEVSGTNQATAVEPTVDNIGIAPGATEGGTAPDVEWFGGVWVS